ncbi:hypothetical protein HY732_03345 [Candidatus Uhrbacteria bacterium]|nr:hypothetical protein [Candidatus Uhrbacteria bacterium]
MHTGTRTGSSKTMTECQQFCADRTAGGSLSGAWAKEIPSSGRYDCGSTGGRNRI